VIFSNKQHEADLPLGTHHRTAGLSLTVGGIHLSSGLVKNEVFGLPCLNLTIKLLLILIEEF